MTDVIGVPSTGRQAASARLNQAKLTAVLPQNTAHTHAVQFYDDDAFLLETVGQFLRAGLDTGDRLLIVATPQHREALLGQLAEGGVDEAVKRGDVLLCDARETLARVMVDGMPDGERFHRVISSLIRELERPRVDAGGSEHPQQATSRRLRAFGEMVDLLWRDGNSRAAIRLEELWNEVGAIHDFSLLCAYAMGNFYREGDRAQFFDVCHLHTHALPTEGFRRHDDEAARLREISMLQQRARALESEIERRKELEQALRDALAERARAEQELQRSLERERTARATAEAADAFKEQFLAILGHDLRNPLNTVLTTARLMTMRRELAPESQLRVDRIVASGVRMERMIDQLLDLTRARHGGGIPLRRVEHDLVALTSKIVSELRAAHPSRKIELIASEACVAQVDGDRFEQVVCNLVGNAIRHGDPDQVIRVEIKRPATVSVHNHGRPIEPDFLGLVFDPFKRAEKPQAHADGLGLGLFISERIVDAHGGCITVESSHAGGTRFEAAFSGQAEAKH